MNVEFDDEALLPDRLWWHRRGAGTVKVIVKGLPNIKARIHPSLGRIVRQCHAGWIERTWTPDTGN